MRQYGGTMRTSEIFSKGATLLAAMLLAACSGGAELGQRAGTGTTDGSGTDTGGSSTVTASGLVLYSSASQLSSNANTEDKGVTLSALVTDSQRNVLPGATVSFVPSSGAIRVVNAVSGDDGIASAVLHTGGDSRLRTIVVTARTGSLSSTTNVEVVAPTTTATEDFRMGTLTSAGFTAGQIQVGQASLAAGGSSGLRVDIVDINNGNAPLTTETEVTFTSPCSSQQRASITSPVKTVGGSASSTYSASGCSGSDTITARAVVGGVVLNATGQVTVQPAELGSIEFVSAEREVISLAGTGLNETSRVTFKVLDATGGPVADQTVTFSLNTQVGGITLNTTTGETGTDGTVNVIVKGGTVHTAVRVTASVSKPSGEIISSQSERLVISTGIPDQNSFSLSASCFNVEGLNHDNVQAQLTVLAADRFNNPVPDGTAISFDTEGGAIASQCVTVNGECSVTWRSQDPRPGNVGGRVADNGPRAGRVTVMASAIGEESFLDQNGNGVFDDAEIGTITDLPEAFRDADIGAGQASNDYALGEDIFLDYDGDQTWDAANGVYNGLLCRNASTGVIGPCFTRTAGQPDRNTVHVRDSVTLIMSGSTALMEAGDFSVTGNGVTFNGSTIVVPQEGIATFSAIVRDVNDQPLPAGATIALEVADAGSVSGIDSYTVVCHNDDTVPGNTYTFSIKAAKSSDSPPVDVNGTVTLTITTEKGGAKAYTFGLVADAP